jgi:hypothetical protein
MNPESTKDSIFSSEKPRDIPWFFLPMMVGIIALIIIYRWFD